MIYWLIESKNDKHAKHCHEQWKHFPPVCCIYLWNAWKGDPGRTCRFELTRGSKNGRTYFSRVRLD